jgi:hypothetical protein
MIIAGRPEKPAFFGLRTEQIRGERGETGFQDGVEQWLRHGWDRRGLAGAGVTVGIPVPDDLLHFVAGEGVMALFEIPHPVLRGGANLLS